MNTEIETLVRNIAENPEHDFSKCAECGSRRLFFVPEDTGDTFNPPMPAHYTCRDCGEEQFENAQERYEDGKAELQYQTQRDRDIDR